MKHVFFPMLLFLFCCLIYCQSAQNMPVGNVHYTDCALTVTDNAHRDVRLLESRGFSCRISMSGEALRATKSQPTPADLRFAYAFEQRCRMSGRFCILELTALGEPELPSAAKEQNAYTDGPLTCTQVSYYGKPYQLASRNGQLLIGTPVIGISY